jgi:hypothetical protein
MPVVWMFTKWYPNREDPQLGVFIQKHAQCISEHCKISVLYIHSTDNIKTTRIEESFGGNLHEVIVYLKKRRGVHGSFLQLFSTSTGLQKGIRRLQKVNPHPDIFHGYILLRTALIVRFLSLLYRKPYVLSEQWSGYATGKFERKNFSLKQITRAVVKKAAAVTIVSRFLQKKMHKHKIKNKNEYVIGNVIGEGQLNKSKSTEAIEVLLVADLVDDIKNISGVLEMIASLPSDTKSKFRLRIIGGGKDEHKLKRLATELSVLNTIVFFEGQKRND